MIRLQTLLSSTLLNQRIKLSSNKSQTKSIRSISSCLHIKGLPPTLPEKHIYNFFKDYGPIQEFATFKETNNQQQQHGNSDSANQSKLKNYIHHNRPPGTTAVISFSSSTSAIMCKEALHWRPFPIIGIDEKDGEKIYRQFVDKDVVNRNPRDRPILNILFETNHMRAKLRPWVKRDLSKSKAKIQQWEKSFI